jgi:hypothetical protein
LENGVLTVTVPKEEVKKPDVKKTIEISGWIRCLYVYLGWLASIYL